MSVDEKGKRFLELIDKQNNLQWKIVSKLMMLVNVKWDSLELKKELESLVLEHAEITKELNSLDDKNSLL